MNDTQRAIVRTRQAAMKSEVGDGRNVIETIR